MPVSPPRHRATAPAYTRAELLVLAAIVVVLIGLLLPAVIKIRAGADRAACSNNLKQIALAALSYHDSRGHLPVNSQESEEGGWDWAAQGKQRSWSWLARVLPYL